MNGEEIFKKIYDSQFDKAKRLLSVPPKSYPLKKWKFIVSGSFNDVMHGVGVCLVEQKMLTQSECDELFLNVYKASTLLRTM